MDKQKRALALLVTHSHVAKVAWILGLEESEVIELLRPRFLAMLRNGLTLREVSGSMHLSLETLERILA